MREDDASTAPQHATPAWRTWPTTRTPRKVAEAARLQAAEPPEPEDDPEPDRGRGWFRRRA
ncbi:hypothetical protein ACWEV4_24735 [Streptomyces sp. NPDC003860]